jgi:tetratricopeptide (TPR) repeat protein
MMRKITLQKCVWIVVIGALFTLAGADEVGNRNRRANRLFSKGDYEEALRLYGEALQFDPSDGKLNMNRGSALYRLDEFDEAERAYLDALSQLPQDQRRALADAHYNLGNIQFRQGEQLESAGDISSARGKYSQALENYINTLKLRPNDKDAKWNLELAHQKVDMLEQMQDQQPEQNDDGDDGDDRQQQGGDGKDDEQEQEQDSPDNQEGDGQNDDEQEQEQNRQPEPQEQEEQDMRREEAERLIDQFSDDAEELNRPPQRKGKIRQPERDW